MAECKDCGKKIGFMNTYDGKCIDCYSHQEGEDKTPAQRLLSPTESTGSIPAATAFTSLAWIIVALTFICTLIVTFATASGGDTFLAMVMFISGCFSAVLLGLLTEISANIAKLVNNSR